MSPKEVNLPEPAEIGHWVAWINYAHHATDMAKNLGLASDDRGQTLHTMAQSLNGGEDVTKHRDYEELVFTMARMILPSGGPNTLGDSPRDGDALSSILDHTFPRTKTKLPKGLDIVSSPTTVATDSNHRKKQTIIQDLALADAIERLDLGHREPQRAKIVWPAGVVAAAGYFRANIRLDFDRKVFNSGDEIEKVVKQYRGVRPRLDGRNTVYGVAGNNWSSKAESSVPGLAGPLRTYRLFWAELAYDRQRFIKRQAELSGS